MSIDTKNLPEAANNQSLFSDYYLDSLIVEQPQWKNTPDIESDYAAIKNLFDAVAPNAEHLNEPQTEREFIQPLLEQLGHVFEVQPALQTSLGTKRPDYGFFESTDAHNTAKPQVNTNQFFKTALAVGDAKAWSRNLDRKVQGTSDPFNNQNPNYQIDFYLRGADKEWGILTNGRQWRLYHRQTSYRLDSFYEVDLAALLSKNGDLETFRYFYCLFRRDAFSPDASGTSFLDRVLGESQQHTIAVSDDLKNRVYDALRLLIGGFLDFPRNGFDKTNPPLHEIHTNCLILLYRLLFILYAESRDLLPLNNRDYAMQYSLDHLATDIHEKLEGGIAFAPGASLYWTGLRQLSTLVNDGWEDHIPQYNGGLFNPQQHPFLENHEIGDDSLAQVIELLTRTEKGERIAYRDLDVRHLGNIYEGLLEFQPQIADQDLVIVSKKGGETVAPKSSPNQEVAYPKGEIYLLTDKGERKATGSYYTPDYIVRYIVENTLAPLCKDKGVGEILSLKILDPATGSGHFLVGVVDYLAEELITHPDAAHMTETASEETELAYWRRRVVESCVYGVDLNPMAVELAKLSLWLHTVAKGAPLSFLDHHIRAGNSLIGAKIAKLSNLPQLKRSRRKTDEPQTEEFSMAFPFTDTVATAIGHYLLIEEVESRTADQIHAKEHQLDIAQTMLRFHKGMANLWTSLYYGNSVSRTEYHAALDALRDKKMAELEAMPSYQRSQEIATEKRFFHWEIEFPEVFRDKYGREKDNPGFDAVVGNPPWSGKENMLTEDDYRYLRDLDIDNLNYYPYFIVISLNKTRLGGIFAMVLPDSLLIKAYHRTRQYMLNGHTLREITHLTKPFEGVDHDVIIIRAISGKAQNDYIMCRIVPYKSTQITHANVSQVRHESWNDKQLDFRFNLLIDEKIEAISNKLSNVGIDYRFICETHEGIHTRHKRTELFPESVDDLTPLHKPLLIGEKSGDIIEPYYIQWNGRYVNYDPTLCTPNNKGMTPDLVNPAWFTQPKLVIVRTGEQFTTAIDREHLYLSNNLFSLFRREDSRLDVSYEYLCCLLNSKLLQKFLRIRIAPRFGRLYVETKIKHLDLLPIRRINFTTPADERDRQLEKAKTLYQFCLNKGSIDCVLGFVKHHLAANPERSDIVHDLLGFLAAQMVEMNKTKGQEIRGFLHWLEREIGVEIEALKNKTAIRGYFDLPFDRLLDVLRKNRRCIAVDLSSRNFQESLEREFTASCAKINPLLTRIQSTDALIDQVVYQLYGLTDEEIAVVEGEV